MANALGEAVSWMWWAFQRTSPFLVCNACEREKEINKISIENNEENSWTNRLAIGIRTDLVMIDHAGNV
jgi:hypothetical protein